VKEPEPGEIRFAAGQKSRVAPVSGREYFLVRGVPIAYDPSRVNRLTARRRFPKAQGRTADIHQVSQKIAAGDFVVCPCKPQSGGTHG
jgi:hypothetical protein